jgi:hypothetical protein
VEESLVGVDIADSVEEGLVEERRLDGSPAVAEEGDEVFERDGERLATGAGVGGVRDGKAAEAAGVYEAELFTAAQSKDGVGVWGYGDIGGGDEEAAGHSEMDEELGLSGVSVLGKEAVPFDFAQGRSSASRFALRSG